MADVTVTDLGHLLNGAEEQDIARQVLPLALEQIKLNALNIETVPVTQDAGGATLPVVVGGELRRIGVEALTERIRQMVAQQGAATDAVNVAYQDVGRLLGGAANVQDALGTAAVALQSLKKQADEATTAAEAATRAAAEYTDFRDNERITAAGYDAGARLLSLTRGEESKTSLAPLTVELPCATPEVAGLLSAADKRTLDETARNQHWRTARESE